LKVSFQERQEVFIMKSKALAAIILGGMIALAIPLTASARDRDDGWKGRPAWAYQHPGWWQYYQRHNNPNYRRGWRQTDRDRDDWYGGNGWYGNRDGYRDHHGDRDDDWGPGNSWFGHHHGFRHDYDDD
jgi:hypothetical protein